MESWPRILGFLPRSLKGFFLNQFREEASEAQLEQLSSVIYKHVSQRAANHIHDGFMLSGFVGLV